MKNFFQKTTNKIREILSREVVQVFLITFFVHAIFVLIFHFVQIPFLNKTEDNVLYHGFAIRIAELIRNGTYHLGDVYQYQWYPLFVGIIYSIFVASMLLGSLINALLVGCSALLFFKILKEWNLSEKTAFWSSLIVMNTYASLIFHTSLLLKEAWIITLLLGMVYCSIRIRQETRRRIFWFTVMMVIFILLRNLRFFIGLAAITGFFIDWFLNANVSLRKKLIQGAGMFLLVNLIAFLLTGQGSGNNIPKSISIFQYAHISYIEKTRSFSELATSANHIQVFVPSPGYAPQIPQVPNADTVLDGNSFSFSPIGLAQSIFQTLLGPFSGQFSKWSYLAVLPDILFIYTILAFILYGTAKIRLMTRKSVLPWLVAAGIIIGCVALGADSAGAIIRQRLPAIVLIGLVATVGFDYWIKKRTSNHE